MRTPGGVRFERRSASGHYIEVNYKPLDNGTILSIHRNITALKERENALAAAKEAAEAARADAESTRQVMQIVLDNMNEGVQLFDKDFKIEFVNRKLYDSTATRPRSAGPAPPASTACGSWRSAATTAPTSTSRRSSRNAPRASAIRTAAATCGAPATARLVEFTFNPLPAAGCSRSATTSPRSSTARRRCARRPTSCKLISDGRVDLRPCSIGWSNRRRGCATPTAPTSSSATANSSASPRATAIRRN